MTRNIYKKESDGNLKRIGILPASECVIMCDSFSDFPDSGNVAYIYLAKDTNYTYRYDAVLKYIELSRPYKELTEVSTDIIVNGKEELIMGDTDNE